MSGSMDRLKGSVKWFDHWRGFGFITPEGSGVDLFVHSSSIKAVDRRWLTAGQSVEFFVSIGSDGRSSAISVTAPPSSSSQKAWYYFRGACFRCNEVGHIATNCKSNDTTRSLGSYHSDRGFPATQPTNTLKPLKLASLSLLPDKEETPVGQISEGMNSVDEEVEQSEVSSEYNERKSGSEWRNWAELPRDTLFIIFKKIAAAEILLSAQFVCRPWRQLSHESAFWRCVDLRYDDYFSVHLVSMAMLVVDRSKGCMEDLTMHCFPTNELMHYVAERFAFVICFDFCCLVVLSNYTLHICHIDCLSISISKVKSMESAGYLKIQCAWVICVASPSIVVNNEYTLLYSF
ncbi:Cold shock domain-containing protein 3 [Platanthera guangdongensis]|uniref:Cold shock domain-containing protein 3 n=1 Tax=Platanthera guangdongensis TaxID=2320717 RepID=A0ABR2MR46_9ASPA